MTHPIGRIFVFSHDRKVHTKIRGLHGAYCLKRRIMKLADYCSPQLHYTAINVQTAWFIYNWNESSTRLQIKIFVGNECWFKILSKSSEICGVLNSNDRRQWRGWGRWVKNGLVKSVAGPPLWPCYPFHRPRRDKSLLCILSPGPCQAFIQQPISGSQTNKCLPLSELLVLTIWLDGLGRERSRETHQWGNSIL